MSSIANILVTINVNSQGTVQPMQQAQQAVNGFTDSLRSVGDNLKSAGADMTRLGGILTAAITVPMIGFGKASFDASSEFELNMKRVSSLMGEVANQFEGDFTRSIRTLATTMGVDAVDAARGLYDVISADIPPNNAISFLETATKAAVAGLTNTETAAGAIRTIVKIWPEEMANLGKVSDVLFQGVNKGIFTFEQLAASMGQALPIAKNLGVSYQEIIGSAAALSQGGLTAAQSFTYLKQEINSLIKPNKAMLALFDELKVATGQELISKFGGLTGAMQALRDASEKTGINLSGAIGRVQGFQAAIGTTGDKLKLTTGLINSMNDAAGATDAAFQKINESTSRVVDKMKSGWNEVKMSVGDALLVTIKPIIIQVTELMSNLATKVKELALQFQALPQDAQNRLLGIAAGVAAIGPVLATLGLAITSVGTLISSMGKIAVFFEGITGAAITLGGALTGLGIAAAAIVTAFALWDLSTQVENWGGLNQIISASYEIFQAIVPVIGEALGAAFEILKAALLPTVLGFNSLMEIVGPLASIVANVLVVAFKTLALELNIVKNIVGILTDIMVDRFNAAKRAVGELVDKVVNALTPAFNTVRTAIMNFITGVETFLMKIPLVKAAVDALKSAIQGVIQWVTGLFDSFVNLISKIPGVSGHLQDMRVALETFKGASDNATSSSHGLYSAVDQVGSGVLLAKPKVEGFGLSLKYTKDEGFNMTEGLEDKVIPAVKGTGTASKETADKISNFLIPAFDMISGKAGEVEGKAGSLANFFDSVLGNTIRTLSDGVINLSDNFKSLGDSAGDTTLKVGGLSIQNEKTMDGLGTVVTMIRGSVVPAHNELSTAVHGNTSAYQGMAAAAQAAASAASAASKSMAAAAKSGGGSSGGSGGSFAPSDFSPSDFSSSMKSSWGSGGSFQMNPGGESYVEGVTKAGMVKYMSGVGGAPMPMGGTASFNSIEVHLWTQEEIDTIEKTNAAMKSLASAGLESTYQQVSKLEGQMRETGQTMEEVISQWKGIRDAQAAATKAANSFRKATDLGETSVEALQEQLWRLIDAGKGSSGAAWELRTQIASLGGSLNDISNTANSATSSVGKASAAMLRSFDGISETATQMATTVQKVTTQARAMIRAVDLTPITQALTPKTSTGTTPRAYIDGPAPMYYGPTQPTYDPYAGYSPGLGDMTLSNPSNVNLTVNVNNADAEQIADTIASSLRSSGMQI